MVGRTTLTQADAQRVAAAVDEAESRTSGEIVVVVAAESDRNLTIPFAAAAVAALAAPLLFPLAPSVVADNGYLAQVLLFLLVLAALLPAPVRRWLSPSSWAAEAARRQAESEFVRRGVHRTQGRTGVLIFVSLAEHRIEILPDIGIADAARDDTWDQAVGAFRDGLHRGGLADGLVAAVERCGQALSALAPRTEHDRDELPNVPVGA